jgi:hypothetical protein
LQCAYTIELCYPDKAFDNIRTKGSGVGEAIPGFKANDCHYGGTGRWPEGLPPRHGNDLVANQQGLRQIGDANGRRQRMQIFWFLPRPDDAYTHPVSKGGWKGRKDRIFSLPMPTS